MSQLTPADVRLIELDDELMQWEAVLNEAQEALDLITGSDYDPKQDPDQELHEQDVEFLENEIIRARKKIKRITRMMASTAVGGRGGVGNERETND